MGVPPLLLILSDFSRHSFTQSVRREGPLATRHFLATLCFRRHMRHVAPLSPVTSVDCAYFPSPRGVPYPLPISRRSVANAIASRLKPPCSPCLRGKAFVFKKIQIHFPATPFVSHLCKSPGGVGVSRQFFPSFQCPDS